MQQRVRKVMCVRVRIAELVQDGGEQVEARGSRELGCEGGEERGLRGGGGEGWRLLWRRFGVQRGGGEVEDDGVQKGGVDAVIGRGLLAVRIRGKGRRDDRHKIRNLLFHLLAPECDIDEISSPTARKWREEVAGDAWRAADFFEAVDFEARGEGIGELEERGREGGEHEVAELCQTSGDGIAEAEVIIGEELGKIVVQDQEDAQDAAVEVFGDVRGSCSVVARLKGQGGVGEEALDEVGVGVVALEVRR